MINSVLALVCAYLIGSIPFGFLLVKWKTGADRMSGSGNIGATNVLRRAGWVAGASTLLLDIAKGYLAVWLAGRLTGGSLVTMSFGALAVLAGHAYPVFLNFRGGKGTASFIGAFLYLTPLALGAVLIVLIVTILWTRQVSMGSIVAAVTFPLAVWLIAHPPLSVLGTAILGGAFILYRHRDNMERIRAGSEPLLTFKGRRVTPH